ncbi:MAG: AI-2E family transporter, partial [Bdellovibrionales bacterium]|nr:AI-2E family transporter [Bdellovibrionales bacterium]
MDQKSMTEPFTASPGQGSAKPGTLTVEQLFDQLPPHWSRILASLMRLVVWGLLFALLYVLRSFFLLIFLTFVFAYLQSHAEQALAPYWSRRGLRVSIVGLVFLAILAGIGSFVVPRVIEQAAVVADNYPKYIALIDSEIVELSEAYPVLRAALPPAPTRGPDEHPEVHNSPTL